MAVSRADMGDKNPVEYREGVRRAREARGHVAEQLGALIESSDLTGSHSFVAQRIGNYAAAIKEGDQLVIRSALMELGVAVGATVASIDLTAVHVEQPA